MALRHAAGQQITADPTTAAAKLKRLGKGQGRDWKLGQSLQSDPVDLTRSHFFCFVVVGIVRQENMSV